MMKLSAKSLILLALSLLVSTQALGEDIFLKKALDEQVARWDTEIRQGRGSEKCQQAFRQFSTSTSGQPVSSHLLADAQAVAQLCALHADPMGSGLTWIRLYLMLTTKDSNQVLQRPALIHTINAALSALPVLSMENIDPVLKASLIALVTEISINNARFDQVEGFTRFARQHYSRLGIDNSLSLAIALSNRGYARLKQGDPDASLQDLIDAEKMILGIDKRQRGLLSIVYRRMAITYDQLQQPHKAIKYYKKSLELFNKIGAPQYAAMQNFNMGILQLELGLHDHAIDTLGKAKNSYLSLGMETEFASTLYNIGKAWYEKGNSSRALNYYQQSERLLQRQNAKKLLAKLYTSMGILYENIPDDDSLAKAIQYYDKAQSLHRNSNQNPKTYLAHISINKGKLLERLDKPAEALAQYKIAENNLHKGTIRQRFIVYNNIAVLLLRQGSYTQALDYARKAIHEFDTLLEQGFYLGGTGNLRYIDQHRSPYFIAVEALIQKGETEKAYIIREQSRNRLFQLITRMNQDNINTSGSERLWQQKNRLDSTISALTLQAAHTADMTRRAKLLKQRNRLQLELNNTETGLFDNPRMYHKVFTDSSLNLARLQAQLGHDEAVIDYMVGFDATGSTRIPHIDAFVIRHDGITHTRLQSNAAATETLRRTLEYARLQKPQVLQRHYTKNRLDQYEQKLHTDARRLHDALFEKLKKYLQGATRLHIIPDGPITFLPFETLRDNQDTLLLKQYTISYLNSAHEPYDKKTGNNTGLLVFGNIDYGQITPGLRTWPRIRNSGVVLGTITNSLGKTMAMQYLQGKQASESRFRSLSPGKRMIFLWTHGEFSNYRQTPGFIKRMQTSQGTEIKSVKDLNAWSLHQDRQSLGDPMSNSFVVLASANDGKDGENDGYLTAREVMGLDLRGTELTVLAGCETGVGQVSPSEGVLGLRKAFAIAGSQQLLISLWQVDATWTGELIRLTLLNYDDLGAARSLQQAKLHLLEQLQEAGLEPYPFYWAGFILVGRSN